MFGTACPRGSAVFISIIKNKFTILMKMRNRFAQVEINSYLCTRNLETDSDYGKEQTTMVP